VSYCCVLRSLVLLVLCTRLCSFEASAETLTPLHAAAVEAGFRLLVRCVHGQPLLALRRLHHHSCTLRYAARVFPGATRLLAELCLAVAAVTESVAAGVTVGPPPASVRFSVSEVDAFIKQGLEEAVNGRYATAVIIAVILIIRSDSGSCSSCRMLAILMLHRCMHVSASTCKQL
jgi:hypothetical protein